MPSDGTADAARPTRSPVPRRGRALAPPPTKEELRKYYAAKLAEGADGEQSAALPPPPPPAQPARRNGRPRISVNKVSFAEDAGGASHGEDAEPAELPSDPSPNASSAGLSATPSDGGPASSDASDARPSPIPSPRFARSNRPATLSLPTASTPPGRPSTSMSSNEDSEDASPTSSPAPDSSPGGKHLRRKLSPAITPLRIARNVHTPSSGAASPTALAANGIKGLKLGGKKGPGLALKVGSDLGPPAGSGSSPPSPSPAEVPASAPDGEGYNSFGDSDDEKSLATTYSESVRSSVPRSNTTGTVRRTASTQARRRKSMADKKLLIPLKDQPTFAPGTYDPHNFPVPNAMGIAEVDLETVRSLGYGNSGVVTLVRHKPSGMLMARKVVALDLNRPRSLRHMHRAMLILSLNASPYLIGFFGCFISQQPDTTLSFAEASICLEFMDLGNVEELMPALRRADGTVEEGFVREVVKAVVGAMEYLYEGFRAVHRDIKPANVLLNSKGQVKLADLGELGTLGDEGYAQSFVGTGVYMSPERINPPAPGQGYSVQADVWSLGVMAVELISGKHPYDLERRARERMLEEEQEAHSAGGRTASSAEASPASPSYGTRAGIGTRSETMSSLGSVVSLGTDFSSSTASLLAGTSADFLPAVEPRPPPPPPKLTVDRVPEPPSVFDLLDAIVNGPAPSIPDSHEASPDLRLFLSRCLDKDPSKRAKPAELARHPWLEGAEAKVEGEVLERLIEYRKSKR